MNIKHNKFSDKLLAEIDKADDLHIAPLRGDGVSYGTPTWIWEVVVDDCLYVRAYNGVQSRWYKAAINQKRGRIEAAGKIMDVAFIPASGEVNDTIDEAYKKKYGGSPYLSSMISNRARAATIRIVPA
ncbi:DUF2255 family protein [Danxiaibacter flavus]|uniref:DUF2255 family protein n=1 Tax=Danxiaibacter flavus TaxID=3049108 RepID=A0ABV3ZIW0_9BACT|nr:DUF2255 family protein [Chitinophagaceae bacterium DXS]